MTMMLRIAIVSAFLGSLAVCDASFVDKKLMESDMFGEAIEQTVMLKPNGSRKLQDAITSNYTAYWYVVRDGTCSDADQPTVSLKCTNGGTAAVTALSSFVSTEKISDSEYSCSTSGEESSHAVDFSCSGDTLQDTMASATIPEQSSDCLSGTDAGNWGQAIQLTLVCGDKSFSQNETCNPLNSTLDGFCAMGFDCVSSCGEVTSVDLSSVITNNACATSGSCTMVTVLSTVFAAAMTMLFW
jgi:hypothetical protein